MKPPVRRPAENVAQDALLLPSDPSNGIILPFPSGRTSDHLTHELANPMVGPLLALTHDTRHR